MQFDISRDFLDGLMLQQPANKEGKNEIKAVVNCTSCRRAPMARCTRRSSPSSWLWVRTNSPSPVAAGASCSLRNRPSDPAKNQNHPFFANLLVLGAGKIMAQVNNLAMHANLPLIPFEPGRMMLQGPDAGQQARCGRRRPGVKPDFRVTQSVCVTPGWPLQP